MNFHGFFSRRNSWKRFYDIFTVLGNPRHRRDTCGGWTRSEYILKLSSKATRRYSSSARRQISPRTIKNLNVYDIAAERLPQQIRQSTNTMDIKGFQEMRKTGLRFLKVSLRLSGFESIKWIYEIENFINFELIKQFCPCKIHILELHFCSKALG